ncbi:PREDICTED: uncharacterized protein LOC103581374 [Galeopterus variegatus]|uniref:Uncharacterized protein LOC103581374 n=1 Tax=Galeopterus variegatus TaxID=482537 RepID=A0ABM0PZA7_GALVR|nr:PREDICTED: uncharacterized protein LOC103581374 [Galeopterus variegatus]
MQRLPGTQAQLPTLTHLRDPRAETRKGLGPLQRKKPTPGGLLPHCTMPMPAPRLAAGMPADPSGPTPAEAPLKEPLSTPLVDRPPRLRDLLHTHNVHSWALQQPPAPDCNLEVAAPHDLLSVVASTLDKKRQQESSSCTGRKWASAPLRAALAGIAARSPAYACPGRFDDPLHRGPRGSRRLAGYCADQQKRLAKPLPSGSADWTNSPPETPPWCSGRSEGPIVLHQPHQVKGCLLLLASRVNCSFYFKIGACRHGDRCSRLHNKPTFSQTILIQNIYRNPQNSAQTADGSHYHCPLEHLP